MSEKRAHEKKPGAHGEGGAPESKRAPQSGTRVKSVLQRTEPNLHAPSTLPPPPFETEVEVRGLEWWLDAQLALAADLLCLRQMLDAAPQAHAEAVRLLSVLCEAVRDALYELYCDAAHPRTADLGGILPVLEPTVRASYAWCAAVVALLTQVAGQLRGDADLDWAVAKASYRQVAAMRPAEDDRSRAILESLPVDFASPVEPLRNLPANLEHLASSVCFLDSALAKRFG